MRQKLFFSLLVCLFLIACNKEENDPSDGSRIRYQDSLFSDITVTKNIKYGEAKQVTGSGIEELFLDLYEPANDKETARCLVICVHGGAFNTGDKQLDNWPAVCTAFAKRGYVAASINYRLGKNAGDVFEPAYRAQQDLRAAIRFARKHASDYALDETKIYLMGGSAGGVTCLNVAYKNEPDDVPASIDQQTWGDLEGDSGNPGYSSSVSGVVSLWGNISDTLAIVPGEVPVGLMHSIYDQTSPYYYKDDPQTGPTYGSFYIHQRAKNAGIYTDLHTYYYNGHGDGLAPPYLDTTISFSSAFLFELVR